MKLKYCNMCKTANELNEKFRSCYRREFNLKKVMCYLSVDTKIYLLSRILGFQELIAAQKKIEELERLLEEEKV